MNIIKEVNSMLTALERAKERTVDIVHAHRIGHRRFFGIVTGEEYTIGLSLAGSHELYNWSRRLAKYTLPLTPEFIDSEPAKRFLDDYHNTLDTIVKRGFAPNPVGRVEKLNPYVASKGFYDSHQTFLQMVEAKKPLASISSNLR
jgi:hypothetical protein